jgi:hypothetical protein
MAMTLKSITSRLGYQQIGSGLNVVNSLTVPVVDKNGLNIKPSMCIIIAETQAVRWRDDGTAPSATVGMPLPVNTPLIYDGDLTKIQFIEQTASAKLNISYYA